MRVEIQDINTELRYEGYLWLSNADAPIEYSDSPLDMTLFEGANPFIREGYLYSQEGKCALTIKHADGHYLINQYDVLEEDLNDPEVEQLRFVTHRMSQCYLKFLRYWREDEAPACLDLPVKVFDRIVFVGFEK